MLADDAGMLMAGRTRCTAHIAGHQASARSRAAGQRQVLENKAARLGRSRDTSMLAPVMAIDMPFASSRAATSHGGAAPACMLTGPVSNPCATG